MEIAGNVPLMTGNRMSFIPQISCLHLVFASQKLFCVKNQPEVILCRKPIHME